MNFAETSEETADENGRSSSLRAQTSEMKAVRAEIKAIRDCLAEKYAENLGLGATSCITQ